MAEVRLRAGTHGLTVLGSRQVCPGCDADNRSGSFSINGASRRTQLKDDPFKEQVHLLLKRRVTLRKVEKLYRVRKTPYIQSSVAFLHTASSGVSFYGLIPSVDTRKSEQADRTPCAELQQKGLLSTSAWTRRDVSIHRETFRSSYQLRTFFTVPFILSEQMSKWPGFRLARLKLDPETFNSTTRSYSWRPEDAPSLYRSKTAYYDILKVSPSATQSQIKTAYYKQSFIYHPDKNPGSPEATQRFSEISEAYAVLGNINLRRKYDRGILNQSDLQNPGRASSKETTSRPKGPQQQRARRFSQAGARPMFDFDAFYQAHYGEQLQREREIRARKKQMEDMQKEKLRKWREQKMVEVTLTMLVTVAGVIFFSLMKP